MKVDYLRLKSGDPVPKDDFPQRHKTLLIIEDAADMDWRHALSSWIARSGCLYFMAWGEGCSSWDDSVDIANLEMYDFGDIPEENQIMTTWHDDEPLEEVFWFAKNCAEHSSGALEDILLLHVGAEDRKAEFVKLYRDTEDDF
ncbi:MAG: hypothetical protein AAFY05_26210 [Pseudomonadota bacterium]